MKSYKRDERIADEANLELEEERRLRCQFEGCKSRWSVDFGNGRFCSIHDRIPKKSFGKPAPDHIKELLASTVRRMP